jgi:hypothetical protein
MPTKRRAGFLKLGEKLKLLREQAAQRHPKLKSQEEAAKVIGAALKSARVRDSFGAGTLGQYESGRCAPSPAVLWTLASLYGGDITSLLQIMIMDRCSAEIIAASKVAPGGGLIGGVPGLATHQLTAKTDFCEKYQLLDLEGSLHWQQSLQQHLKPRLAEFWVGVPFFRDATHPGFYQVVEDNIAAGVRYVYFVPESELLDGGKFTLLRNQLTAKLSSPVVAARLIGVGLTAQQMTSIRLNHLIANPHLYEKAVGFQGIRHDQSKLSDLSLRLSDAEVFAVISTLKMIAIEQGFTEKDLFGESTGLPESRERPKRRV